jgi:AcrR family transcriptional regulator
MVTVSSGRRPGRPVGGKQVVDRDLVLDAAERAIRRDGPLVSLEAIALEAGVTKPVIYARIGGRTELSNALSARLANRIVQSVLSAIAGQPIGRSSLVLFLAANLETVAANRELFLYVTGGSSDDSPQRSLYLASQSAAPLAAQLSQWRTATGHDPAVAEAWSYAIVGMLQLTSLWWLNQVELTAHGLAEQLAELLWSGLRTPPIA